jgi:ATPase family associated with various cellular activities (AAA)
MAEVRLRAGRRALWLRQRWQEHHYADEHLLAITHSEVDRALGSALDTSKAERLFYRSDPQAAAISAELAALRRRPEDPRLAHLIRALELTDEDAALLKLTLGAAINPSMARVFGYLLDMTEAADPTPALARALFEQPSGPAPPPDCALMRWLLAEPLHDGHPSASSTGWRVDPLLPGALAADDWSLGATGRSVAPPGEPVLHPRALEEIVAFLSPLSREDVGVTIEIELIGPPGSGRAALAAQAAAWLGRPLVAVDAGTLNRGGEFAAAATREARRAELEGAIMAWERPEITPPELWATVPSAPISFVLTENVTAGTLWPDAVRRSIRCGPLVRRERLTLWSSLSTAPAPPAVRDWALRPSEIELAARVVPAGDAEVAAVCRRVLTASRPDLLTTLPLSFGWEDLVLAPGTVAHLRELEAQARDRSEVLDEWGFARLTPLGRGTTALFSGPSGTGKTMAAQVLARSLGLELYRVDLAGVVNKYIGETEKHLRQVFELCERAPALLLFDEADALFGKRSQVSDAHDRYANIEIDYLLQRMEQFDGTAILTTNRKGDLDTAFVRRLRFIVDFAPPSASERERLWRLALDGATDADGRSLVGELDWHGLARELDLTGAGIKSAALAAAFLARTEGVSIGERHVLGAARRELEKQGVVVRAGQMELR